MGSMRFRNRRKPVGPVQLQRLGGGLDGGVVTPVEPVQGGQPGLGLEDHHRVAHPAGRVERTLVDGLGSLELTVVEQHPAEAGLERSGEAAEQRLVGLDGRLERLDRGGVVAGPLVEVGDHAEAHRVHDRPVEAPEALGGGSVVTLGRVEVAVEDGQLGQRVRCGPRRRRGPRVLRP